MKSEVRHDLEKNELAHWLARVIEALRPYQNAILGGVILVAVILLAYTWLSRQSAAESTAAWNDLLGTMVGGRTDPSQFEKVIKAHPGTITAHWAAVLAGESYLSLACDELFHSKAAAREDLQKARESFQLVLEESRVPELRERATYGLAMTDEAAGDLDKAIESWSTASAKQSGQKADRGYRGVVNLWPEGTFAAAAEARLKDLEKSSTREFYDDFARWEPKGSTASEGPGVPGLKPPTEFTLPDEPLYTPTDPLDSGRSKPDGGGLSFPEPDEDSASSKSGEPDGEAAKETPPGPESGSSP